MSSSVSILGVPFRVGSLQENTLFLQSLLQLEDLSHVMTPNNEMLVQAAKDPQFHALLTRTAGNVADSTGIVLAARLTGQRLPARTPGVDLVTALAAELDQTYSVFLLGGAEGVAERAAAALQQRNPQLRIAGTYGGSPQAEEADDILSRINTSGASILLVAFGAPKQDTWIDAHRTQLPNVRLAMGVGGTFDFLAGEIARAPRLLRRMGLEWLWRLILQPRRIGRIWRAVVVFPLLILRYGRRSPHN